MLKSVLIIAAGVVATALAIGGLTLAFTNGAPCADVQAQHGLWPLRTAAGCFEFWLNRYQALIAGLGAIAVASFAAGIAWRSVQRQIRADDDRADRLHNEALVVAVDTLRPTLEAIDAYWRGVSLSMDHAKGETPDLTFATTGKSQLMFHESRLDALPVQGTQLSPLKEAQWARLVFLIRDILYWAKSDIEQGDPLPANIDVLEMLEEWLTDIDKAYKEFSGGTPDIFAKRRKRDVELPGGAHYVHRNLDELEERVSDREP